MRDHEPYFDDANNAKIAKLEKTIELWKTFALALNEEPMSQDRVIKAYEALSEAGLIEDCCPVDKNYNT